MEYNIIFDISNFNYPWFENNISEIITILIIIIAYFVINKCLKKYLTIKLKCIIPVILIIFFGTCLHNLFSYVAYQSVKKDYLNKKFKVVEGYVKNVSLEYGRINFQHFSVQNINFEISDSMGTGGYNRTIIEGGKIYQDKYIRLHYIERTNDNRIIAKLEIKK